MTWAFADRLRAILKGKLVLKGIVTQEDTKIARNWLARCKPLSWRPLRGPGL